MTRTLAAELVDDAGAQLGEGVAYDAVHDRLTWVDILAGRVFVTTAKGHGGEPVPPLAGGLFAVRPGVTGPPATPWDGLML